MAVTIKEIQEKVFAEVAGNGYSMEEVDDFLDAVVETMAALTQEKNALQAKAAELSAALAKAEADKAEMEKKLPDYNEAAYFRNLETAIRESMINAQRIADAAIAEAQEQADKTVAEADALAKQTVADAAAGAEKTVAEAEAHAKTVTEDAQARVTALQEEENRLTESIAGYKKTFRDMIEAQMNALGANA